MPDVQGTESLQDPCQLLSLGHTTGRFSPLLGACWERSCPFCCEVHTWCTPGQRAGERVRTREAGSLRLGKGQSLLGHGCCVVGGGSHGSCLSTA